MNVKVCERYPAYDGVLLAADVYLPDGPGPFPIILTRTPYDRVKHLGHNARQFVERGYGYVATDCRGRFESEGHFTRMFDEEADGQATVEWIADQKWCNGRIALWGVSYGAVFQIPAAVGGHSAIRCICPIEVCNTFFNNWSRYDGCFALENPLWWIMGHGTGRTSPPSDHVDWDQLRQMNSLDDVETAIGFKLPILREIVEHDTEDEFWHKIDQWPMHPKMQVPGMHCGGWFDHVSMGQFNAYQRIRDLGATEEARMGQRLFMGPWGHITFMARGERHCKYGIWEFGQEADISTKDYQLRFLDLHMKDIDDGLSSEPPVYLFLMGENRWLSLDDWPPPGSVIQKWHLDSQGNAHGQRGDGILSLEEPTASSADKIVYDPAFPVPTCGGQIFWNMEPKGPQDQRHLLERDDVLFYQSELLTQDLVVIGDVGLEITIATDVDDTDIVAKLCVIEPNASITCIIVGSFRCSYREGWDKRVPMEHGVPTQLHLRLSQLAYTFPVGSRVALMITSSDFPRIQPHTGTMSKPWTPVQSVVAHTEVQHGKGIVSCLQLPIYDL